MNYFVKSLSVLLILAGFACSTSQSSTSLIKKGKALLTLEVQNPNAFPVDGVHEVVLNTQELQILNSATRWLFANVNGILSPVELSDKNGDGAITTAVFEAVVPAQSVISVNIYEAPLGAESPFVKKTQAEIWHRTTGDWRNGQYRGGGNFFRFDTLRVPDGFTDHTYFIKYEGPGWESDKVGYRMYLDWRNANDIFGKKVTDMVLQDVGVDGFESYHHMADWGMDILKVGRALGVGSIGWFDGENAVRVEKTDSVMLKISADGLIRSQIKTWYYGWETGNTKNNLISVKSIDAGSRMTRELLIFEKPQENVCSGFIIEKGVEMFEVSSKNGEWKAIASWGLQSLAGDNLGMAVLFPESQNPRVFQDKINHLVVFEKPLKQVEYYFLAAWEQEPGGIKNLQQFKQYLQESLDAMENLVVVSIK